MIEQSRSYEHRGVATRRDHLMPVIGSTWARVHRAAFHGPEHWVRPLLGWLAFGCVFAAVWRLS